MAQFINHFVKVQPTAGLTGKWSTKAVWEKVAQIKRAIRDSYFRGIGKQKSEGPAEDACFQIRPHDGATKSPIVRHRLSLQGYKSTLTGHAQRIQQQMAAHLRSGENGPFGRDFLWRRARMGHLVGFASLFLMHEENLEQRQQMTKRWDAYNKLCENIKVMFTHEYNNTKEQLIPDDSGYDLADFKLGKCIAVGSNGAVCEAKLDSDKKKSTMKSRATSLVVGKNKCSNKRKVKSNKKKLVRREGVRKLAVKMIFNFDSSNAGAILRLTEAEMLTCGRGAISGLSKDWQNGSRARKKRLPPHPNVIEIQRALIGKVPDHPRYKRYFPAALPHPVGFGRSSTMFFVMKRYECTLESYIKNSRLTTVQHLLALQLLQGVAHLERNKVAHRDLKANNIFIEHDLAGLPRLVIGDFGCSFVPAEGEDLVFPFLSRLYDVRNGNGELQPPEIKSCQPGPKSVLNYRKSDAWATGILLRQIMHRSDGRNGTDPNAELTSSVIRNIASLLSLDSVEKRMSCQHAANVLHLELFGPKLERMLDTDGAVSNWLLLHASETMAYKPTKWGGDSVACELFCNFLANITAGELSSATETWLALREM